MRLHGCLNHCQFILGPEVRTFESDLAAFCGARHVVTCASGTDALVLALRAMGVGAGDAVPVPVIHVLRDGGSGGAGWRDAGVRGCRCKRPSISMRMA